MGVVNYLPAMQSWVEFWKDQEVVEGCGSVYPTLSSPSKLMDEKSRNQFRSGCAWSEPAGEKFSCIGATQRCSGGDKPPCYAMRWRHLMKNVMRALARNKVWIDRFRAVGDWETPASILATMIGSPFFRWFESGDVLDQFMIMVIVKVSELRPEIPFWLYTRSFQLDWSSVMERPNITVFGSADRDNLKEALDFKKKYGVVLAYGPWNVETDGVPPTETFVCPASSKRLPPAGACMKCRLCIYKGRIKKDLVFPEK